MDKKLIQKALEAPEVITSSETVKIASYCSIMEDKYDSLLDDYRREAFLPFSISFGILLGFAAILFVIWSRPVDPQDYLDIKAELARAESFLKDVCHPNVATSQDHYDGKHITKTIRMLESIQSKCLINK